MHIGQLARLADVPIDTVRYYERHGILPAPAREGYHRPILAALSKENA